MRIRSLAPAVWLVAAATLVASIGMPGRAVAADPVADGPSVGFATWEVPVDSIRLLGSPRTELLVKAFSTTMDPVKYLDEAARHGQRVVVYFRETVDEAKGAVYPSRVARNVEKVRGHPALAGYLSVKEPSWNGISLAEMRSLYAAYRAADPGHPVIALLGDIPHFGTSQNPWGAGAADELWVDWYPVTYSRGYISTGPTHFRNVRAVVDRVTPGTPIWLMVQGHGYRPGDRRTPTVAELERQVRDGLSALRADGIVFYTWNNALYDRDLARNPTLWSAARSIVSRVRAGTFMPPTSDPTTPGFTRLSGPDRYATAVSISKAAFPSGAPVAYLATGANFPDALAGAVAAARDGGPLLLTGRDALPPATASELARLAPGRVVVLGGTAVVGGAVVTALRDRLPGAAITRLSGPDRYATAVSISKAAFPSGAPVAYLATGANFPDALAGAVAAARDGGPLLLTGRDALPPATASELARLAPGRVVVLGGTAVVGGAVVTALRDRLPGAAITRLSGPDRYATAVSISKAAFPSGAPVAYLATGANFPDALAGAVAAARDGGPLLLTGRDALPPATASELARLAPGRVVVLGGSSVISYAVAHVAAKVL